MRLVLSWVVLLFVVVPAIADDADDDRFNTAYRSFNAASESGDIELAITSGKAALDIATSIFEPEDRRLAILTYNYGDALVKSGQIERGRSVIEHAIDALVESSGKYDPDLAGFYAAMANTYRGIGNEGHQLKWYKRALAIKEHNDGEDSVAYANLAFSTGVNVFDQTGSPKGEKYLKKALAIYQEELGATSVEAGWTSYQLSRFAFGRNDHRESSEYLLDALAAFAGDTDDEKTQRLFTHAALVENYELLNESDSATKHCIAIGREMQLMPDQEFTPLFRIAPQYPEAQLKNGVEGYVELRFTVDENGFVRNPEVLEGKVTLQDNELGNVLAGYREEAENRSFEAAALAALERYRYAPRFVEGVPIPVEGVKARITFKIADE